MEDIQVLAKRGATPHGPAYGYKEVTDETEKKDYYSNPFNQKIRGAHKESIENQAEDSGEVKKEGEPSGLGYGYNEPIDEASFIHGEHYSNPLNQTLRGVWLNIQMLNKRGASPSGPAYGYKQVSDEVGNGQADGGSHFSNPFG